MGLTLPAVVSAATDRMGGGVWWPLVAVILGVMGSRAVVVGITSLLSASRARPWRTGWRRVLVWAGLRGAVSLEIAPLRLEEPRPGEGPS
jgi:NhaP-type Na+/H+ or K+/H+ antiporter